MIEFLHLKNFRAIADMKDLRLGPGLNVLIGRNGSGKSSLIEALRLLHEAVVADPASALARWPDWTSVRHRAAQPTAPITFVLGIREHPAATFSLYALELSPREHGTDVVVELEHLIRHTTTSLADNYLLMAANGVGKVREESTRQWLDFALSDRNLAVRHHADRSHQQILAFAEDLRSWRFIDPVPALMRPPTPLSADAPWPETGSSVALQLARATRLELREVSRRLSQMIEGTDELDARLSSEGALLTLKDHVHRGLFPSWTLSGGTLRLLAILTALHVGPPPALLCVEEPENSLHPTAIDALLTEFRDAADRGTQVIITSHSPYLLDRVNQDVDAAYFVDRLAGAATFTRLPADDRFGLGERLAQGALAPPR